MNSALTPDLVSVIIPCYNGAVHLAEAIASVYHQTYPRLELILIDDGSTDDTAIIADRYPAAHYIYQPNQGVAVARNRGLQESTGRYLLFLDQDDRLLPDGVAIALQQIQAHPECAFVFGQSQTIRADGSPVDEAVEHLEVCDYAALLRGQRNICPPSTVLFQRMPLVESGGFEAQFGMADDYDVYLKLARVLPIYQYFQPVVEYRKDETNQPIAKLIQLRGDTQRVMDAQKPFVAEHPGYADALQQGETHWQYVWETILLHCWVKAVWRGKWQEVNTLWCVLKRSPILFSAISVYLSWWMKQGILNLRKFFSQFAVSSSATPST
jgi:glycosyltransferase involved in cell wall biosynthesis